MGIVKSIKNLTGDTDEKKVEYLELVYDLIFIYVIGRTNSLLHNFDGGFVQKEAFIAYFLCTLAIIQIWDFSTYYINMYGRNSVRDHIFLIINMFLLYLMGTATRIDWLEYQDRYHIAWGLIIVNIAVQYLIELRNHKEKCEERSVIIKTAVSLFLVAAIVLSTVFIRDMAGVYVTGVAIVAGIVATIIAGKSGKMEIDFEHLTERAMLYVVFTFGEMIIAIAEYFDELDGFDDIFFAVSVFLIVVGLFLSYELIYDYIIDRNTKTNGIVYMFFHIWIIFGLNNLSASFEFMREEEVDILPKMIFLVASFVVYFGFLFATTRYSKLMCAHNHRKFLLPGLIGTLVFAVLMFVFMENMYLNIILSVVYVYFIFFVLYRFASRMHLPCTIKW